MGVKFWLDDGRVSLNSFFWNLSSVFFNKGVLVSISSGIFPRELDNRGRKYVSLLSPILSNVLLYRDNPDIRIWKPHPSRKLS